MVDVYVGLGSNLDPQRHLKQALAGLELRVGPLERSHVYRSAAVGAGAPDYLNLVARCSTSQGHIEVREALAALEAAAGRARTVASECSLDLDLLLYGRRVDAAARVPRADVLRHPFVLAPLSELAGGLPHPVTGEALDAAWRRLASGSFAPTRLGDLLAL